jgi:hypothetical protein
MSDKRNAYGGYFVWIAFFTLAILKEPRAQLSSLQQRAADSMRLRYLNDQYIQSWIKSDTATYIRLLWADEFVHLSAAKGKLLTKKELAPVFGAKRFDQIDFFYADSVIVRLIADSVAFIYAVTPYREKGASAVEYSRYNDVYIKYPEGWKCVAANTVNIALSNFRLPEIKALHSSLQQTSSHTLVKTAAAILQLNQQWVKAFAKNDQVFLAENGAEKSWITYPDGSLEKGNPKAFRRLMIPAFKDSIVNETVFFPRKDFAIVRNVLLLTVDHAKTMALQMCNYYLHHNGKWEMVSFNATAIRDE